MQQNNKQILTETNKLCIIHMMRNGKISLADPKFLVIELMEDEYQLRFSFNMVKKYCELVMYYKGVLEGCYYFDEDLDLSDYESPSEFLLNRCIPFVEDIFKKIFGLTKTEKRKTESICTICRDTPERYHLLCEHEHVMCPECYEHYYMNNNLYNCIVCRKKIQNTKLKYLNF